MPALKPKSTLPIIQELKSLGFSEYEAKIYLNLVGSSPVTAYELAKLADVPRPNTYSALSSLANRGAAMPVSQNPARYVARDPRELLLGIAEQTRTTCHDLAERMAEITAPHADDYVWNLSGFTEINAKMGEMIANAKDVIWIKSGPEVIRPHQQALMQASSERDVRLSVILFGEDAEEFRFNDNCEIHIHEASGVRMGTADNLFTITVDHDEMLTANENNGIHAAHTQNKAIVKMALSLIRHDYYMAEIFKVFKNEIDAEFGPHLYNLRRRSYSKEQMVSFMEKTGTEA